MRAACVLLALAACSKPNPYYCAGAPMNNCTLLDSGSGSGCTEDSQCAGQVCDTQMHACVACTTDKAAACTGTTPVCTNDACAACTADAQCPSGVCRFDGSCEDEGRVAYVGVGAMGTTCTKADKCAYTTGVNAGKPVVHFDAGAYTGNFLVPANVTLVGRDVVLQAMTGTILAISPGRVVTVEMLAMRAGTTGSGVTGAQLGTGASLTLDGCDVGGTEGIGIDVPNGGSVTLSRTTVHDNLLGGIYLRTSGCLLDMTNTLVYLNGGAAMSQNVGGVMITGSLAAGSRIDFDTIVDNGANATASAHAGGIVCDNAAFSITNSIIAHNSVGGSTTASNANTFGLCSVTTGDIVLPALDTLLFRDAANHDYHLTAGTPAEGHAVATSIAIDIDGDHRPQGTGFDTGADELAP